MLDSKNVCKMGASKLPGGTGVTTTRVARVATTGEATTASTTGETTGAGSRATLTLFSALNTDVATIEFLTIKSSNSGVGTLVGGVGDKAEATGTTSLTVTDNDGILDGTELLELGTETFGLGTPGETTNEKLNGHRNRRRLKERRTRGNEPREG